MHVKPKKGLGQNFLVDNNIKSKIFSRCHLQTTDIVIEIGPGKGALTGLIAQSAKKVFAIEIDRNLCEILQEKFIGCNNIKIINKDFLKVDLRKLLNNPSNLKIIGNIPYYITSPIIEHIFKYRKLIGSVYLTVQKEFARRIVAPYGGKDYGSFSCFVQYYSDPAIEFTIRKGSFLPVPKVDSCFLRLDIKKKLPLNKAQEKLLFKVIRGGFSQRRKMLKNTLSGILPEYKIKDISLRPEQVDLAGFIKMVTS